MTINLYSHNDLFDYKSSCASSSSPTLASNDGELEPNAAGSQPAVSAASDSYCCCGSGSICGGSSPRAATSASPSPTAAPTPTTTRAAATATAPTTTPTPTSGGSPSAASIDAPSPIGYLLCYGLLHM